MTNIMGIGGIEKKGDRMVVRDNVEEETYRAWPSRSGTKGGSEADGSRKDAC